jgi:transposase
MQGKVKQSAEAQLYVGIDVSKGHLDVYLHPLAAAFRVANDKTGWKTIKRRLKKRDVALVVVEATGKYHRGVHRSFADDGFDVAVINPYRSRSFGNALGELAKTDEIDARVLALAGEALRLDATQPVPKSLEDMAELMSAITAFKAERTANRNRLGTAMSATLKRLLKSHLKSLERRIKQLECELMARLKADPALWRRYQILTSIPGIGPVTAMTMIVFLAELGSCSPKQVAALVGVAPMNWDSGLMRGQRHIRGGRAKVRCALYMAAVSAARCASSEQKAFYDRLRANGKPAKLALTAVIRKLAILANTLITEDRQWQPIAP